MSPFRRIRVLHIIQNLNYGGMERLLSDIVRGVDAQQFESHVLVLQYVGRFGEGLGEYARVHSAPSMNRTSMLRPSALADTIHRISPDVVHSHSGVWYKASLAARMARVPMVIHTEHGRPVPDPWQARWLDGMASRRTDVAVAVSRSVAETLERRVVKGRCDVRTILNGVDTNCFRPRQGSGSLRDDLGIPSDAPVIGSVGRLEWVKGYDVMIDAFASLIQAGTWETTPRLVIAGDGAQRSQLEQRVREYGLHELVHLPGWRDDVHDVLSGFTCFSMSSRSEGTSVSLLEAMSSGLCPVVTDVGGNRAVLGDDLAHRLVPAGDAHALARAWLNVLCHDEQRRLDESVARTRVRESYSAAAMLDGYAGIYTAFTSALTTDGSGAR